MNGTIERRRVNGDWQVELRAGRIGVVDACCGTKRRRGDVGYYVDGRIEGLTPETAEHIAGGLRQWLLRQLRREAKEEGELRTTSLIDVAAWLTEFVGAGALVPVLEAVATVQQRAPCDPPEFELLDDRGMEPWQLRVERLEPERREFIISLRAPYQFPAQALVGRLDLTDDDSLSVDVTEYPSRMAMTDAAYLLQSLYETVSGDIESETGLVQAKIHLVNWARTELPAARRGWLLSQLIDLEQEDPRCPIARTVRMVLDVVEGQRRVRVATPYGLVQGREAVVGEKTMWQLTHKPPAMPCDVALRLAEAAANALTQADEDKWTTQPWTAFVEAHLGEVDQARLGACGGWRSRWRWNRERAR